MKSAKNRFCSFQPSSRLLDSSGGQVEKSAQFAVPFFLFLALFPSAAPVYELVSYFPLSYRLSFPIVPSFLPPVKTGKDGGPSAIAE